MVFFNCFWIFFFVFQINLKNLLSLSTHKIKKRRWQKIRIFLMLLRKEIQNLSKFFFKIKKLMSTFKDRFFSFSLFLSLSLFFFFFERDFFFFSYFLLCCFEVLILFFFKYGEAVLHKAAEKGFEDIVKVLLEHGATVDIREQVLIFFFFFVNFSFSFYFFFYFFFFKKYFLFVVF